MLSGNSSMRSARIIIRTYHVRGPEVIPHAFWRLKGARVACHRLHVILWPSRAPRLPAADARMRRGKIRWYTFAAPDKRRPVLILGSTARKARKALTRRRATVWRHRPG